MRPLHLGEKGSILPEPHIPRILLPACSQITHSLGSTGPPHPTYSPGSRPARSAKADHLLRLKLVHTFLPPPAHLLEAHAM